MGRTTFQYMRSQAAPQVRAASSTSGPICISDVLKNCVDKGAARNTKATARPTTLPYRTERNGVARKSHNSARLMSTPGTAQGAQTNVSTMRRMAERYRVSAYASIEYSSMVTTLAPAAMTRLLRAPDRNAGTA